MNSPRIAAVGGGYFSQFHFDAWLRLPVDPVGVCDLDINRAMQIAAHFASAEAFDDAVTMIETLQPDLLDVIVPPAALTQRAHDAGVICWPSTRTFALSPGIRRFTGSCKTTH